jgi:hypothetical protein
VTAQDIELAVARHFGYRQNLIVPNVAWGWNLWHEADLIVLRPSGLIDEVEIKISAADIKRDLDKGHQHWDDPRVARVWFAVPEALAGCPHIPARAGILAVSRGTFGRATWTPWRPGDTTWTDRLEVRRPAQVTPRAQRRCASADDRLKLAELAAMRIWSLKTALADAARRRRLTTTNPEPRP